MTTNPSFRNRNALTCSPSICGGAGIVVDVGNGIAVDQAGNAYVTGYTSSFVDAFSDR
jgi:hypothetical protein